MIYAPGGWSPNVTAETQMLTASDDERIVPAEETGQFQATIPAELFRRAGVALFGDQYVAPMAVALGVDKNTVGKWAAGKTRVPPGAWLEVRAMIEDRYSQIFPRLLAEIEASAVCEELSPNVRDGGQVSTGDIRRK